MATKKADAEVAEAPAEPTADAEVPAEASAEETPKRRKAKARSVADLIREVDPDFQDGDPVWRYDVVTSSDGTPIGVRRA